MMFSTRLLASLLVVPLTAFGCSDSPPGGGSGGTPTSGGAGAGGGNRGGGGAGGSGGVNAGASGSSSPGAGGSMGGASGGSAAGASMGGSGGAAPGGAGSASGGAGGRAGSAQGGSGGSAGSGGSKSPGCPANAVFCDDFEAGGFDKWSAVHQDGGSLTVAKRFATSGSGALFVEAAAGKRGGFLELKGSPLFPLPVGVMYGRMMVRFEGASPDGHTDIVRGADGGRAVPFYNLGEQHHEVLLNYFSATRG